MMKALVTLLLFTLCCFAGVGVNAGSKVQRFGADLAGLKVQRSYP